MGVKGKVGKERKDQFYLLAKQQGFRARSAFKLTQLGHKFRLFDDCLYVIDLCAAPGGWMQVARQAIPLAGHVFGVDLVPIRGIQGCTSIVADITTPKCDQLLLQALNQQSVPKQKVDLVLHDGAPNVGASWDRDAYVQNELALKSLQLACKYLKPRGAFVSKVFRSADYTKLLYVFQQLFRKVQATKPTSSRNVSAEIFVVCQDYLAPTKISKDLFDINKVFEAVEDDAAKSQGAVAAEALKATTLAGALSAGGLAAAMKSQKKKNRSGYDDGDDFRKCSVRQFFESGKPADILVTHHRIEFTEDEYDEEVAKDVLTTPEIHEFIKDLKLLGRPDMKKLMKWRYDILNRRFKEMQRVENAEKERAVAEEESKNADNSDEALQAKLDAELDSLLQKEAKTKLNVLRKQKAKQRKLELKAKIASAVFVPDTHDPELFSDGVESMKILEEEEQMLPISAIYDDEESSTLDGIKQESDSDDSDDSESDGETDYVALLAKEMEERHAAEKEMAILRGLTTKEKKLKETRRQRVMREWAAEAEQVSADVDRKNYEELTKRKDQDEEDSDADEDADSDFDSDAASDAESDAAESDAVESDAADSDDESDADSEAESTTEAAGSEDTDADSDDEEVPAKKVKSAPAKASDPFAAKLLFSKAALAGLDKLDTSALRRVETDAKKKSTETKKGIETKSAEKKSAEEVMEKEVVGQQSGKRKFLDGSDSESDDDNENRSVDSDGIREMAEEDIPKIPLSETQRRKLRRKADNERKAKKDQRKAQQEIKLLKELSGTVDEKLQARAEGLGPNATQIPIKEVPKFTKPDSKDEVAEIQAIGSLMAKKKSRMDLMDGLYNRWAFEDEEDLPEWFKEDDEIARIPELPVTKEMVAEYRRKMREIYERPIRKVAEAKARKKAKLSKKMESVRNQAMQIADSTDLNEKSKSIAIDKLMKKAKRSIHKKTNKNYQVAGKGGRSSVSDAKGKKKGAVSVTAKVDKRLKADKRGMKAAAQRAKGGKGSRGRKGRR